MSTPKIVVALPKPNVDAMLDLLDKLRVRVVAGEFTTLWLLAFTSDGKLLSAERGSRKDKLHKIGQLECLKQDLILAMETGDDTGF
jgi:hypothetical protein